MSVVDLNDEIYREKYLKYKNKYLELKSQSGGVTLQDGVMCYFTTPDKAEELKNAFIKKPLSLNEITKVLDNQAYVVEDGSFNPELNLVSVGKKDEKSSVEKTDDDVIVKKIQVKVNIFNRCEENHIKAIKRILEAYGITFNKRMVVIRVNRVNKNRLMNIVDISSPSKPV